MKPFCGKELADRPVVEADSTVDAFVEDRPREERAAVGVIPVGEDLPDAEAAVVLLSVWDAYRRFLGQSGRRGDKACTFANAFLRNRVGVCTVLVAFIETLVDAGA